MKFGMPMGPLQMGDMAGLEIGVKSRASAKKENNVERLQRFEAAGPYDVVDYLVQNNRIGQKTGRGYYI